LLTLPKPPFGRLKVAGFEKYASVFVNGAYMGHADEFNGPNQGLLLNPGDYEVKVSSQAGNTLLEQTQGQNSARGRGAFDNAV
jgi:hypothetical protein